jgi:hypothetical protein
LATASSPPGKTKKPKAAELSISPVSTPETVKRAKAKPVEVASTVVHFPPPPAEVARLTSPVAAPESSKDSAAAVNAVSVTGSAETGMKRRKKKSRMKRKKRRKTPSRMTMSTRQKIY